MQQLWGTALKERETKWVQNGVMVDEGPLLPHKEFSHTNNLLRGGIISPVLLLRVEYLCRYRSKI